MAPPNHGRNSALGARLPSTENSVNLPIMRQLKDRPLVDIIPSNFLQTRMLSNDEYPIAQRETLIWKIPNRRI